MFRAHDRQKNGRSARFALESLEQRVELSGLGVAAQYTAAIDRLNGTFQSRVERIDTHIQQRTAQLDNQYSAALNHDAARIAGGHGRAAHAGLADATVRIDRSYNRLVRHVNHSVNALTRQVNHQASDLGVRSIRFEPAIADVAEAAVLQFRNGTTALGNDLRNEVRMLRSTARADVGPVVAVVAQERAAGRSATTLARAEASRLSTAVGAQTTVDQSYFQAALASYDQSFASLQSRMAALPPGPVARPHTAGALRTGTDLVAFRTGLYYPPVNGLGTGTVTFTGMPGADATSGTGGGHGSGVEATGGVGLNPGSGTETITGIGTGTTGVGATITAGHSGYQTVGLIVEGLAPDGFGGYEPSSTLIPADI